MIKEQFRRPSTLVDVVTDKIRSMISRLKIGEKLPTENDLIQDLGVSRTTVREAVTTLKSEGLIESRQGVGVFVISPKPQPVFRLTDIDNKNSFAALYELRIAMEASTAELAAYRRNDEDLVSIEKTLMRMKSLETRAQADAEFHLLIAKATGNEYFEKFVFFLNDQIRNLVHKAVYNTNSKHPDQIPVVIKEHYQIYDAIKSGNGTAAYSAMRSHLINAANRSGYRMENYNKIAS